MNNKKINYKPKIYLASPFGFFEAGREFMYGKLINAIEKNDFEVIDPWKLTPEEKINSIMKLPLNDYKIESLKKLNSEIASNNQKGIDISDGIIAVLDGLDIDSGTSSEIGYANHAGKPIMGYRSDFRLAGDNLGSIVNLQVEYFIRNTGGNIVTSFDDFEKELPTFYDLVMEHMICSNYFDRLF